MDRGSLASQGTSARANRRLGPLVLHAATVPGRSLLVDVHALGCGDPGYCYGIAGPEIG